MHAETPLTLEKVLACPSLPSLPKVALDVLSLCRDPEISVREIAEVVQYDPALSARILRTVNSSWFSLRAPCTTIPRAASYLGLNAVKSLVLGFGLVDLTNCGRSGLDLLAYWRRCVYSAASARLIAKRSGVCDPEEAFTAALMQDVGMLTLHAAAAGTYRALVDETAGDHSRLPVVEARRFGFTHADAGAGLGARWNLPERLIEPIRLHHNGTSASFARHAELVRAVALSYRLTSVLAFDGGYPDLSRACAMAGEFFGFTVADVRELLVAAAGGAPALAEMLSVGIGGDVNVDRALVMAERLRSEHAEHLEEEAVNLRRSNVSLAAVARTDALTGAGNRHAFDEELASRFARAAASGESLGLLMVDVDRFKTVNDAHGHAAGDAVLVEVARRLAASLGERGVLFRYGGEEFAIILAGFDRRRSAAAGEVARRAIAAAPFTRCAPGASVELSVTVSIGVAAIESESRATLARPDLLVQAADRALYAAKRDGRDRVRVYLAAAAGRDQAA